ncbi:MAG: hypothetical protein ACRETZ_10275 [Steroidobacteraceae bacterium]
MTLANLRLTYGTPSAIYQQLPGIWAQRESEALGPDFEKRNKEAHRAATHWSSRPTLALLEVAVRVHHKLGTVADRVLAFYRRTLPDATPVEREIAIAFYNYQMPDLKGNGPGLAAVSKSMLSALTLLSAGMSRFVTAPHRREEQAPVEYRVTSSSIAWRLHDLVLGSRNLEIRSCRSI